MSSRDYLSKDDALTLKAVILYILKNSNSEMGRSVYYVVKTAFLAQQKHLSKYLCPLFEDKIMALPFGPVPSNLYDALKIARGETDVKRFHQDDNLHLVYDAITFSGKCYLAKEDPDMDYLSKAAVECIDLALEEMSVMSFKEIKEFTHNGEWQRAFDNPDDKSMDYLAIAKEGGADEASLSYLKESMDIDALLNS